MRLYIVHGSPNCRKALAVVYALDLELEVKTLDFTAGDLRRPEYLAVNPNALVPALDDGNLRLWESNAIMQYLALKMPGNTLFPDDSRARADITRWQFWETAHFNKAVGAIVFENFIKPTFGLGETDARMLEMAIKEFHRFAPILETPLKTRPFVCGDHVTLADFSLGCQLMYAAPAKVPFQEYSCIDAWYRRLEQVPAWTRAAPPGMQP